MMKLAAQLFRVIKVLHKQSIPSFDEEYFSLGITANYTAGQLELFERNGIQFQLFYVQWHMY